MESFRRNRAAVYSAHPPGLRYRFTTRNWWTASYALDVARYSRSCGEKPSRSMRRLRVAQKEQPGRDGLGQRVDLLLR